MKLWSIPEESQSAVVVVVVVVRKMKVEAQVEDYFSPSRASRVAARGLLTGCPMRFSAGSGTRDMRHMLVPVWSRVAGPPSLRPITPI